MNFYPRRFVYSATQVIRKWERDSGVECTPIVALTAYARKEEWQRSIDVGCTAHITKPVKKATLMEAIREYTTIRLRTRHAYGALS